MFSPNSTIRKSDELIAKYFGGTRFFYILLTHKDTTLTDPALWHEVDAIVNVVRCFEDKNITHVEGAIDPIRDIELIKTELILADLESLEKRLPNLSQKD
jgi:predicted RND superfamily exporter protein